MKRHLRAILAADIVGFSRLMEQDEAGIIARQQLHFDTVINPKLEGLDGRIVKLMGDGILLEFGSVVDAVTYAVAIQKALQHVEQGRAQNQRLEYRMGINMGDVFYADGDILGDGVNIAARLEQMADPGGICISGTVFDLLKSNVQVGYEPLGEISVKNIQQPVRAYRIVPQGQIAKATNSGPRLGLIAGLVALLIAGGVGWWMFAMSTNTPPSFNPEIAEAQISDKPSIAVLPFNNMSNDPDQEYFSDGITEDLITDLSKVSGLFVLARNTTFIYKSQAVNVQQIGRDLGVGYVVEGSVRRAGNRVRINAQLIDVRTGGHVWAERYDRDLTDVFELQDDVVQRIVQALAVTLNADEKERLTHSDKVDPDAYDAVLRGLELLRRFTPTTNLEARLLF